MSRDTTAHSSIQNNLGATQLHIQLSIQGGVHKILSMKNFDVFDEVASQVSLRKHFLKPFQPVGSR